MHPTLSTQRDGYLATFRGSLSVDQLEDVRLSAAAAFEGGSLRWAVLDLREAWVEPAATADQERKQLENLHFVAQRVRDAATPDLRMAVVSDDDVTKTLLRLCATAVEMEASGADAPTRALAHFDDVEAATAWARGGTYPPGGVTPNAP